MGSLELGGTLSFANPPCPALGRAASPLHFASSRPFLARQVHPKITISKKSMTILNSLVTDTFEKVATEAGRLVPESVCARTLLCVCRTGEEKKRESFVGRPCTDLAPTPGLVTKLRPRPRSDIGARDETSPSTSCRPRAGPRPRADLAPPLVLVTKFRQARLSRRPRADFSR